ESAPVPVHASVPARFKLRFSRLFVAAPPIVEMEAAASAVVQAPICRPPVQSKLLRTVKVTPPALWNVPLLCWNVPTLVALGTLMVALMFRIAVSLAPGNPLSRSQFNGLNQLWSAPPPASQTNVDAFCTSCAF